MFSYVQGALNGWVAALDKQSIRRIVLKKKAKDVHALEPQTYSSVQRSFRHRIVERRVLALLIPTQLACPTRPELQATPRPVIRTKTIQRTLGRQLCLHQRVVILHIHQPSIHHHLGHLIESVGDSAKTGVSERVVVPPAAAADTDAAGVGCCVGRREAEGLRSAVRDEFVG